MKKIFIKILEIIFFIIFIFQSVSFASSSTIDLKKEQEENNKKINESKSALNKIESEKKDNIEQVNNLTSKISEYQSQITSINTKIQDLNKQIITSENEINQAQKEYQEKEEILKKRLVVMYESGNTTYLDFLLSSQSLTDFISNYYLLSEVISYDKELLKEIQNKKKSIEESKKNLEISKQEVTNSKSEIEKISSELKKTKTEKNTYIAKLSEDEKNIQQQIDSLNQANISIDAKIKSAMSINKNNNSANKTTNNSGNSSNNANFSTTISTEFIKPVNSVITTGMYYSSGQYHGAVDYGASGINGSPVYAVGDGEVIIAESLTTSYGNYIVIQHDNGLFSLYAHGQTGSIRVSKGQRVLKGQQIMNVGSTGNSTGPHLHFEIRKYPGLYGDRVNPLNYIPN